MLTDRKISVISIIIPTLNEEFYIRDTLAGLDRPGLEVIVVDGGSSDRTVSLARKFGAKIFITSPCRAVQLNFGARKAKGDILLFLHGDTILPPDFMEPVRGVCGSGPGAGAFQLTISGLRRGLRLVEAGVWLRSRWLGLPYGDQALFMIKELFWEMGGFAEVPILEDYKLVKQLRKKTPLHILPLNVTTSDRRWKKLGVIRTTLINQLIIVGSLLGFSVGFLAKMYRIGKKG